MTQDRSANERISAWLREEAPAQVPDRVLEATFEGIRHDRRRAIPWWRYSPMTRTPAAIAVGATAVLFLAIGVALVVRPGPSVSNVPSPSPSATSTPSVSPTQSPTASPSPTLAPVSGLDGRFVFSSDRSGNREIYVMNPDRTGLQQLTNDPADDRLPTWSPDGQRIAFTSNRTGENEIWVMNADGTEQTQVTTAVKGERARWSPDGSQLVVAAGLPSPDPLYLITLDGEDPRVLLDPADHGLEMASDPFWAPGDRIGFTALGDRGFTDLYTVGTDGTSLRQLTTTNAEDGSGSWSPDGQWIAFQSDEDNGCIYRINADGTGLTKLKPGCGQGFGTTWSPDGTRIGWAGGAHGPDDIHVMNADGTDQVVLTTTRDIYDLSWADRP